MIRLNRSLSAAGFALFLIAGENASLHATPHVATIRPELEVTWRKRDYSAQDLPAELGPGPAAAIEVWADWVRSHDYRLHLSDDGRVLLVSSVKNGKVKRQLRLIEETSELFDELFPAPPREEGKAGAPSGDGAQLIRPQDDGPIPEDPEGGPAGWGDDAPPLEEKEYSYEWGAGTWPVDTETCVFFVARDEEDYGDVLDALASRDEYLRPWLEKARTYTGFVLEKPLAAAYIQNAAGMEEWDPDNEVVNRVAQMLMVRRFSQLPYWFVQGFAWHIEMELRNGIYCFPYRDEFIFATEHTGWNSVLANRFDDREKEPLRLAEFTRWQRGGYDDEVAKITFGIAGFLSRFHADDLSAFAEELRLFREKDNRIDLGNGTWERKVDYRVPDEELLRLLEKHFGDDVLTHVTGYFRKGKRYKLPR